MSHFETLIQIALIAFLAWGGVLSLRCLLRDRRGQQPGRALRGTS